MFFMKDFRKNYKGENTSISELAKIAGEKWKTLTDNDKKGYQDLANKDKKRYETDLANGMVTSQKKSKKKVVKDAKKVKDPNAPKKARTAYICFLAEFRKNNANKGSKLISLGAVEWKGMNDEQKKVYIEMEAKDKERYATEYKKYESSGQLAKFEASRKSSTNTTNKSKTKKVAKPQKKVVEKEIESDSTESDIINSASSDVDVEDDSE